jgi:hypothetical protein
VPVHAPGKFLALRVVNGSAIPCPSVGDGGDVEMATDIPLLAVQSIWSPISPIVFTSALHSPLLFDTGPDVFLPIYFHCHSLLIFISPWGLYTKESTDSSTDLWTTDCTDLWTTDCSTDLRTTDCSTDLRTTGAAWRHLM